MKKEKTLLSSLCLLIGVVLAIFSLFRGKWQIGLLITVFTLWGLWVVAFLSIPYIRRAKRIQQHQRMRETLQKNNSSKSVLFEIPQIKDPSTEQLLLMHVNHRISMYLRSTYGDITWEWCSKNPIQLITNGGTGRIRVFGIRDFDHAEVTLKTNADIQFDMLHMVPLSEVSKKDGSEDKTPPNKQPVDPQIWYESQGRHVLESLVADLNSRGHTQMMLDENGDISIQQDQENVITKHLANFPEITYWPRLVRVLEGAGLAAVVSDRKIVVSW